MKTGYFTSEITNVCEEALMNTVMEPLFSLTTCITSVDMMSMCSKGLWPILVALSRPIELLSETNLRTHKLSSILCVRCHPTTSLSPQRPIPAFTYLWFWPAFGGHFFIFICDKIVLFLYRLPKGLPACFRRLHLLSFLEFFFVRCSLRLLAKA